MKGAPPEISAVFDERLFLHTFLHQYKTNYNVRGFDEKIQRMLRKFDEVDPALAVPKEGVKSSGSKAAATQGGGKQVSLRAQALAGAREVERLRLAANHSAAASGAASSSAVTKNPVPTIAVPTSGVPTSGVPTSAANRPASTAIPVTQVSVLFFFFFFFSISKENYN